MQKYIKPEIELLDTEIVDIIMASNDVPTVDGDGAGSGGTLTPGSLEANIFD